jgi:hypothetical protein
MDNSLRNSRPRNSKEKIIRIITFFELYRCKKCGWRGWKLNFLFKARTIKKILFYIFLMLLASIIVYSILRFVA